MCLDKNEQYPGVLLFIAQKIRAAISESLLFLNSILSTHYYLSVRH